MSEYPYRSYSPSGTNNPNRSPTRRTAPVIPPAGIYPSEWNRNVQTMPGFEGWRTEDNINNINTMPSASSFAASTPNMIPEVIPKSSFGPPAGAPDPFITSHSAPPIPPIPQPSPFDHIPPSLQAGSRASHYSSATTSEQGETPFRRRHVRTPSASSTESASRSRRPSRQVGRDRTPSTSPSRAIPPAGVSANSNVRTPSGNVMASIFNAENAAAVGNVLGSAASFLGSRAGLIKNENEHHPPEYDSVPGGYNSRPVPDTVSNANGFNIGDAVNYLSHLTSGQQQTPSQPPPPPQQQAGGSPFTLSNALSYLSQQQAQQRPGAPPGTYTLAGIDIDFNWLAQKAGEQNPWVLLGGAVVAFWIISSIIATIIWYGIVAGVLYVVYIVGVKNGGFEAILGGDRPPPRRVGGSGGGTGAGTGWNRNTGTGAAGGTGDWRRRY
ncbi:hypothetical protein TWF694_000165 [Orbilia ellipsospora]|uniref:Uncharacterized protein n=1 Tax=Orbilia ellipsospora TaxID=2528407 RepID=A0AAV9XN69_9PEZI